VILSHLCDEAMRLESILEIVQSLTVRGTRQAEIAGIACDSRQVRPGFLFVALPGRRADGRAYIGDAVQRGAVAVVSEGREGPRRDVTHIQVEDARRAMAEIACAFYEHPARDLEVIGITGTKGKTTTAFLLRDILRAAGRQPGLIGTVWYEMGDRRIPAGRTTPESIDVQSMLDQMRRARCQSAVMEVSSHALDQKRVWGIDFDVGVFTNLTRDHLDYHGTMENYFAAKLQLFRGLGQMEKPATAVVNLDDDWGQTLANWVAPLLPCVTYGLHPAAAVRAEDVAVGPAGSSFRLVSPWGERAMRLPLLGRFNVSNALAAIAAAGARGVELDLVARVLFEFETVPGRLERIPNDRGVSVFVDYAHTDDALANVLATLREIAAGRLILVFGCGGDRDRGKRPIMGAVAARGADHTILTSDNPRSEDPAAILAQIAEGFGSCTRFETIPDREAAIAKALALARPGDTVLLAGKGHENYQEFAHTVVPFDDRDVARRILGTAGPR
jgi:UDP-N-acetylmuramoyl-L-alanyl-D-glutamate--2,6-diaminopimelate ligase